LRMAHRMTDQSKSLDSGHGQEVCLFASPQR
jgi:hypothetical protein